MKNYSIGCWGILMSAVLAFGIPHNSSVWATSLAAQPLSSETASQEAPKNEVVKTYVGSCRAKPVKKADCDRVRQQAIDILKEDLLTLGSSANKLYLETILPIFKSDEPELRIAALDAVGMIGPTESILDHLAVIANDPVPDVRKAASQMLQRGKGERLVLLARRTGSYVQSGRTPSIPPDPKQYGMPIAPDSTYLFFASDPTVGRLDYTTTKTMKDNMAFFKLKAKKGPLDLEAFNQLYEQALDDEQQAREQEQQEAAANAMPKDAPKDPTTMEAFLKQMVQAQASMANQAAFMAGNLYPPDMFSTPKVFVLEERKIGQRSYPTRYVVLYEDRALNRTGYRLCWMTVSDQKIKTTQATTMMQDTLQEKIPEEEVTPIIKEKSEKERKKFKQEQLDLEKELGL